MGLTLLGLLGDPAMKQFLAKTFETKGPRLWIKYIDDTFAVLEKGTAGAIPSTSERVGI